MQDPLAVSQSRHHKDGLPVLHDTSRRTYLPQTEDQFYCGTRTSSIAEDWFEDLWGLCDKATCMILTMSTVGMLYIYNRADI
jgi:hypothetical protein